jgi:hypothetical protein
MYTGRLFYLVPQELLEEKKSKSSKKDREASDEAVHNEKTKHLRNELRTIFADAKTRRKIFLLIEMLFSNRNISINSDYDVVLPDKRTPINAIELLHRLSSPAPLTKEVKQFLVNARKQKINLPQVCH